VESDGRDYFYDMEGLTKFPFHWTQNPTQIATWPRLSMSALDKAILVVFDQLPCKFPTRELVALYGSSKRWTDFIGM